MISSFNLTDKLNSESIQILVNSKIKKISQHGFLSNISNASNKKNATLSLKDKHMPIKHDRSTVISSSIENKLDFLTSLNNYSFCIYCSDHFHETQQISGYSFCSKCTDYLK